MSVLVLMQARKVTFYRNGDRFFTGLVYPIKPQLRKMEQYRAFEQLLAEVQKSPPLSFLQRDACPIPKNPTPTIGSQTPKLS